MVLKFLISLTESLGIIPDFESDVKQMQTITIIGCGDIGKRVAAIYLQQGAKVRGLVRTKSSEHALQALVIEPIVADLENQQSMSDISYRDNTVFYFAPPPSSGTEDTRMCNWLAAINVENLPQKIVLLSTTAVYGDAGGDWINEQSDTSPSTDRGLRRLNAEQQLLGWASNHQLEVVILRVPGIYGPGRLPRERLKKGLPVLNESECGYTNRIHSDDLAMICLVAANKAKHAEIFNVSDGKPGTMTDWFNQVADFLELPRPPQISMQQAEREMSAGMLSYLKESRRIDNSKMLKQLDITLQYESIGKGIPASL